MIIYAQYSHDNLDVRLQQQSPKIVIIVCIYFNGYHKTDDVNFVRQTVDLNMLKYKPIRKVY